MLRIVGIQPEIRGRSTLHAYLHQAPFAQCTNVLPAHTPQVHGGQERVAAACERCQFAAMLSIWSRGRRRERAGSGGRVGRVRSVTLSAARKLRWFLIRCAGRRQASKHRHGRAFPLRPMVLCVP